MYSWQIAKQNKETTLSVDANLNGADAKLNVVYQTTLTDDANKSVNVVLNPTAEGVVPQSPILMKKRHQSKISYFQISDQFSSLEIIHLLN
jgi:hypothetical protein